jgi:hypothetical protein
MKRLLKARRRQILRALAHVNREIAAAQKHLTQIETRLAVLAPEQRKAA